MAFWRRFLFFFDFLLPFPLAPLMIYLWYIRSDQNVAFASCIFLLPLLWGYIFPGIGTNVLKIWRFRGPWLLGNYYWHHGLMYASPLSLLLFTTWGAGPETWGQALTIILATAGVQGFFSCQHDIQAIKCGTIEIENRPAREGRSAEEIVNYFSPITFYLLGASYALAAIAAHHLLVGTPGAGAREFWTALGLGLFLMLSLPSAPWFVASYLSDEPL